MTLTMRFLLLAILFLFASISKASTNNLSLCDYLNNIVQSDNVLIFIGTLIESVPISESYERRQYQVDKLLYGDIITTISADLAAPQFENTDSTVWINVDINLIANQDAARGFFALKNLSSYNSPYYLEFEHLSYFAISDDETISGYIYKSDIMETIKANQVKEEIINKCVLDKKEFIRHLEEEIIIAPNPSNGISFNIILPLGILESDFKIEIYDSLGRYIGIKTPPQIYFHERNNSTIIYTNAIPSGHYFVRLITEKYQVSKNLIIIN